MDDPFYRFLKYTAIALALGWVGWSVYDGFIRGGAPGDTAYKAGDQFFEDGLYDRALQEYNAAIDANADHIHALRGKARALMQLEKYEQALAAYDTAIQLEPEFGGTYANRGILYDRTGRYQKAIADYERALELDPELADGPNWMTRFLRLQPEKPPTIADRAQYLREELAKPESERVLRIPEVDEQQRSYKM